MRQHTSDDHLVDEHAPRVAIAVVIDVGYLRIASSLESHNCHPSARERRFRTYSLMVMGDARVFLCSMPFRASSYASDHG